MNDKLNEALNEISDKHLKEADKYRHRPYWVGAVAAALALIIGLSALFGGGVLPNTTTGAPLLQHSTPGTLPGTTASIPIMPTFPPLPIPDGPVSPDTLLLANLAAAPTYPYRIRHHDVDESVTWEEWRETIDTYYNQPEGYADSLNDFFIRSTREFLNGDGNRVYSPLNVYMALAMLAECTDGNSRQQILDLLNADSIESLRTQAGHVWNAHYWKDGRVTSLLANSLWLDEAYSFNDQTAQTLADSYYASIFHGDLGTDAMNEQLRTWLNSQTGGLLEQQIKDVEMTPETVFSLASTILFSAKWSSYFSEKNTAPSIFHSPTGDYRTEFMNSRDSLYYYWGDNFSAVKLPLNGFGSMWLFLPDEGYTPQDLLNDGDWLECAQSYTYRNEYGNYVESWKKNRYVRVNLSIPKFDIVSQTDLVDGMKNLGVTNIFYPTISDFSPLLNEQSLFVTGIDHAARVAIDEEGVTAAAYTITAGEGGLPPDQVVDFTLDRPFFFVITSPDRLPLFTGIVNQP